MAAKTVPTLTPDQSKAARRELTLSQNNVIAECGIQAYKLKQFEAGRFRPDMASLKKLREFYESQGVDFDQLDAHAATPLPAAQREASAERGMTPAARPGFLIADEVSQDQVDSSLDRMAENDARIAELIAGSYSTGLFGVVSDESEAAVRELFGLLAESHLLFRFLQGKNIVTPATDSPKTIGDLLSQWVKDSPAYSVFGLGAEPATPARSKPKATPAGDSYDDTSED